jgi:hypothetical protein
LPGLTDSEAAQPDSHWTFVAQLWLYAVQGNTEASPKMISINKKETTTTTHRVQEHELLRRLELLCETAGFEFPKNAWPKDDHKAYFLLGVCVTEDMKDLSLAERLERLDDWARQRNLLRPNETLFARRSQISRGSQVLSMPRKALQRTVSGDSRVFANRKREGEAWPAIPADQLIRKSI